MKAYTDIEQSKKLAEILPIESADMCYLSEESLVPKVIYNGMVFFNSEKERLTDVIHCWSLTALMDVLPSVIKRKGKRMFLTLEKAGAYNLYYKSPNRLDELWETKEEPIDACVSMIENLHEQKLL